MTKQEVTQLITEVMQAFEGDIPLWVIDKVNEIEKEWVDKAKETSHSCEGFECFICSKCSIHGSHINHEAIKSK